MRRMIYNMQTMLQVRDLRESIAFYSDLLGFKVEGTFPADAPTWAGLYSGNARMMLTSFDGVPDPKLTGQIYTYPDDLDAAWELLRDAAPVVEPPTLREYAMREFSIRDPNGYLITFGASTGEPHDHEHPHDDGEHGHSE